MNECCRQAVKERDDDIVLMAQERAEEIAKYERLCAQQAEENARLKEKVSAWIKTGNTAAAEIARLRAALQELDALKYQSDRPDHLSERAAAIVREALRAGGT